jgi:hypothetical protein
MTGNANCEVITPIYHPNLSILNLVFGLWDPRDPTIHHPLIYLVCPNVLSSPYPYLLFLEALLVISTLSTWALPFPLLDLNRECVWDKLHSGVDEEHHRFLICRSCVSQICYWPTPSLMPTGSSVLLSSPQVLVPAYFRASLHSENKQTDWAVQCSHDKQEEERGEKTKGDLPSFSH